MKLKHGPKSTGVCNHGSKSNSTLYLIHSDWTMPIGPVKHWPFVVSAYIYIYIYEHNPENYSRPTSHGHLTVESHRFDEASENGILHRCCSEKDHPGASWVCLSKYICIIIYIHACIHTDIDIDIDMIDFIVIDIWIWIYIYIYIYILHH